MEKKHYLILFLVLGLSGFFFSISYSKETGIINEEKNYNITEDNIKVITSLGETFTVDKESVNDLSLINNNNEEIEYVIKLKTFQTKDLNIELDNEKITYDNEIIYKGLLAPYGTEGDYKNHSLKIQAPSNTKFELSIEQPTITELYKKIKKDNDIYQENDNYRYTGINPNNYIKYNNNTYRILGIIDNKIKLISEPTTQSGYAYYLKYLSIDDYLKSFNNEEVTNTNSINYKSWLNIDKNYWLSSSDIQSTYAYIKDYGLIDSDRTNYYYNRTITNLDINILTTNGDGSLNNPYEVSL